MSKRALPQEEESPSEEGWTEVHNKRRDHRPSPTKIEPNLATNAPKRTQRHFNKFKVVSEDSTTNYQQVRALELNHGANLNLSAHLNLQGQWILTPKDQFTFNLLTSKAPHIVELHPEDKLQKAVVYNYPLVMNEGIIINLPYVHDAVRQYSKSGAKTKTMVVTFKGKIPAKINLGIWGSFPTHRFNPEPLRCFHCQKFGHHKSQCSQEHETCAICSARHPTNRCLAAHKAGKQTRPKCPNCKGDHHAWNPRCPERLRRIPISPPKSQASPEGRSKAQQPPNPQPQAAPKPQRQPRSRNSRRAPTNPGAQPQNPGKTANPALPKKESRERSSHQPTPASGFWATKPQDQPGATQGITPTPQPPTPSQPTLSPTLTQQGAKAQQQPNPAPPCPQQGNEPSLTFTKAELKSMLQDFAMGLAQILQVDLAPQAVDKLLHNIVSKKESTHKEPTNSKPRNLPKDIPLDLVTLPEETPQEVVLNVDNFPPLQNPRDPRLNKPMPEIQQMEN